MSNKDKFISFCQSNQSIPIFMQYWWLDAVSGDNWDVILMEENNKIIAFLPYFLHKKYCFKSIIPPHLTPIGGVWLSYEQGMNQTSRYTYEIKVMDFIAKEIDKLKIDFFSQKFNHQITNWLGFYWNGFKQTTCYTYRVLTLNDLEKTFSSFESTVKKRIRKLQDNFIITTDITEEEFYQINSLTYKRQGIKCPFSFELFQKIEKACKERDCSKMFAIKDKEGNIHSVSYVLFDNDICYGLFSGTNPEYRKSNSPTILLWEVLKYASNRGCTQYDYTGSMMKQVEIFIRHFGTIQTPYFLIEKNYSKLYTLLRSLKH